MFNYLVSFKNKFSSKFLIMLEEKKEEDLITTVQVIALKKQ